MIGEDRSEGRNEGGREGGVVLLYSLTSHWAAAILPVSSDGQHAVLVVYLGASPSATDGSQGIRAGRGWGIFKCHCWGYFWYC